MAYIIKHKKVNKKENLNHKFYNTTAWRNCRFNYLSQNPLCEICKKNGKLTLAVEVHHITPLSTVLTLPEKFNIGLNVNNLQSLCVECHHEIHKLLKK